VRLTQAFKKASPVLPPLPPPEGKVYGADCIVHCNATTNNVHVTVSSLIGAVVSRATGGMLGKKHRARTSSDNCTNVALKAAKQAVEAGYKVSHLQLMGNTRSRVPLIKGLVNGGLEIKDIRDISPVPTPGTRPPSARRL
jgi:small subunit ribosomal protein S11